jgi:hypothetical protein
MTHVCCPHCRLRFTAAAGAYLAACPQCGAPPQASAGLEGALGFRLFKVEDDLQLAFPEAVVVSMPVPDPHHGRS